MAFKIRAARGNQEPSCRCFIVPAVHCAVADQNSENNERVRLATVNYRLGLDASDLQRNPGRYDCTNLILHAAGVTLTIAINCCFLSHAHDRHQLLFRGFTQESTENA